MKTRILVVLALALMPALTYSQGVVVRSQPLPLQWGIQQAPAAATQGTISKAAAAGTRHVATGATVCLVATANQTNVNFNLRDGASGAGTIVWTARLAGLAGTSICVSSPPFAIVGTVNTAMTLESGSAPAATNYVSVALSGYDVGW